MWRKGQGDHNVTDTEGKSRKSQRNIKIDIEKSPSKEECCRCGVKM